MKGPFYLFALLFFFSHSSFTQNFDWAKSFNKTVEGDWTWGSRAPQTDAVGNVYTAGGFTGPTDFDPGPGIYQLPGGAMENIIYVSKLDALGNFVWAKEMGTWIDNRPWSMVIDAGYIYLTGDFMGVGDFDPGPGVYNLTSVGATPWSANGYDVFIVKLDTAGNFIWARSMGGSSFDGGYSISVDGAGNIYVVGWINSLTGFNPAPVGNNLTSAGHFITKLDAAGNFIWAKSVAVGSWVATDGSNIYVTGSFTGTVDFDPAPGGAIFNITSAGNNDIGILKLTLNGIFVWAKSIGGSGGTAGDSQHLDDAFITIDALGNVYTTSKFTGTVDFDPGPGTSILTGGGAFISKLDASGNFVWAKAMNGSAKGIAIYVDTIGNIYTGGRFHGTVDFDPGSGIYNMTGPTPVAGSLGDMFALKLNGVGDFVWACQINPGIGGIGFMSFDDAGNTFLTGGFYGTVDFDPGAGVFNMTATTFSMDAFVVKLSQSLGVLPIEMLSFTAKTNYSSVEIKWITGSELNNDYFIIERSTDALFFVSIAKVEGSGTTNETRHYSFTDYHPIEGTSYYRLKQVDFDGKFEYSKTVAVKFDREEKLIITPIPVENIMSVYFDEENTAPSYLQIINAQGTVVAIHKLPTFTGTNKFEIDISSFLPGIYFVKAVEENGNYHSKAITKL